MVKKQTKTLESTAFYDSVWGLIQENQSFIIVHLIEASGSTPQTPGAKLLVYSSGETEFTIGGGPLEAHATNEAILYLKEQKSLVKEYNLSNQGMHCGGEVKLFYQPVNPTIEVEKHFYYRVYQFLKKGKDLIIAHLLSDGESQQEGKAILNPKGEIEFKAGNFLSAEVIEQATSLLPFGESKIVKSGNEKIFLEVIESRPLRLLIFGAGHVGAKLAELAACIGIFKVEIADDREEYADPERLPFVDQVHLTQANYKGGLPRLDGRTFVAIMTRGHQTDKIVLKHVLKRKQTPPYLGMIGSNTKWATISQKLGKEGISEERSRTVRTPIGLPIGGNDPEEIAISVLAELVKVKNNLRGG